MGQVAYTGRGSAIQYPPHASPVIRRELRQLPARGAKMGGGGVEAVINHGQQAEEFSFP